MSDRYVHDFEYIRTEYAYIKNGVARLQHKPKPDGILGVFITDDDGNIIKELFPSPMIFDKDVYWYIDELNSIFVSSEYEGRRVFIAYKRVVEAWVRELEECDFIKVVDTDESFYVNHVEVGKEGTDSLLDVDEDNLDLINLFNSCLEYI